MRTAKYHSNKQEKKVSEELNCKTVVASGSLWGSKGDVRHKCFLIECKTTGKDYYPLSIATWNKIEREAIKDGLRIPLMCIHLNHNKDNPERFAVYRPDSILIPKEFNYLTTGNLSFRICSLDILQPYVVSLEREKRGDSFLRLAVIPWCDFAEYANNLV